MVDAFFLLDPLEIAGEFDSDEIVFPFSGEQGEGDGDLGEVSEEVDFFFVLLHFLDETLGEFAHAVLSDESGGLQRIVFHYK